MATKEQQLKANGVTAQQVSDIEALFRKPASTPAASPAPSASPTPAAPSASDSFLSALQSKLMSQSDVVSSQDSNIEAAIGSAIQGLQQSRESSGQAIESGFNRAIDYARTDQANTLTQQQEGQRGYATNVAALRQLVDSTDRQINDLESRKQEALLSNDAATAAKISELQLKSLEFKQESEQRVFSNLLSIGNFALQGAQQAEQKRQFNVTQSFQERAALSSIALTYGVRLEEGDTIDTVVARAAPFASQKQKLELAQLQSQISRNNAEAQKALRGDDAEFNAATISIIAQAGLQNPSVLSNIKDPKVAAQINNEMSKITKDRYSGSNIDTKVNEYLSTGAGISSYIKEVEDAPFLTPSEKSAAKKRALEIDTQKAKAQSEIKYQQNRANAPFTTRPAGFFGNTGVQS